MYAKTLTALTLTFTVLVTACSPTAAPTGTPARSATAPAPASPSTSASTSLAPTVAPTVAPTSSPVGEVPSHGCGVAGLTLGTDPSAELAPGVYTVVNPPMEFAIPTPTDEWRWFGAADCAGGFVIRRATGPAEESAAGQIAVIVTPESVDAAVAEWQSLEGVSLSSVRPAELGGATGVLFETVLPTEQDVIFVHGGFNPHGYVAVYALAVAGQAVVVIINQFAQDVPFVDEARPVVESFRFDA